MKKQYLSLVALFLLMCGEATAQLVGVNCFLQGNFVEVGVARNGSYGAGPAPAGYHPAPNTPGPFPVAGGNVAMVYDWGHDGWGVGTPPYYGDFTFPGTPFEGWAIQVNGARSDAWYSQNPANVANITPAVSNVTGSNTNYSVVGGVITGVWQGTSTGTSGGMAITQTSRVEPNGSWVVVTTEITNTSAAPLPGVYYWRTTDPDNDQTRSNSFSTVNRVIYQNDAAHRVMVNSIGQSHRDRAYLALATKDCRAKAFCYRLWSPYPSSATTNSLDRIWNQTSALGNTVYTAGWADSGDYAIGLIYNIGTINPGQTAVISYAYIFNDNIGIDSAFPEPVLVVNGIRQPPSGPAPAPTYDTIDVCGVGPTNLPVSIDFATDKNWTSSSWTWAPSVGLSSTTGTNVVINTTVLPAVITYTITGNDSNVNMMNCNYRVVYLTVKTCNGATINDPCIGDTLKFNAPGDSTGASYAWYGPGGFSGGVIDTHQAWTRFPSTWPDTGTYYVIKTVLGIPDTAFAVAVIHPKPVASASSNSPLCLGALDTLYLFGNSNLTPATYSWSGPAGFSSGLQNPVRPNLAASDTGWYTLIVTTSFGCKDTDLTQVRMLPPPGPPQVTTRMTYCQNDPVSTFTVVATGSVKWFTSAAGTSPSTVTPVVSTAVPGTFKYYFNQTIGRCISDIDSITVIVYPEAVAAFNSSLDLGCFGDVVAVTSTSTNANTYSWNFGDGTPVATTPNAMHTYSRAGNGGTFTITLTVTSINGCTDPVTATVDTRHTVNAQFAPSRDTFCATRPDDGISMTNNSSAMVQGSSMAQADLAYSWNLGDGTPLETGLTPVTDPKYYPVADSYHVTLIVTDTIGCKDTLMRTVFAQRVDLVGFHDTTLCMRQPMYIRNYVTSFPIPSPESDYNFNWTESPTANLTSTTAQHPYMFGFGTYVDFLTATHARGGTWQCYDTNTFIIHSVLGNVLQNVTLNTTIPYGTTIQLNAENEVYYHWVPNDGTVDNPNINNPIAAPLQTTTYTIYGMDQYGCVDSANVTITIDSTLNEGIPSAFTPNGDGLNDVFRPVGLKYQRLVDFRIFNRWGEVVFSTANAKEGWDGTFKGTPQDAGVYLYNVVVAKPDGTNKVYKGDVTLIR